MGNAYFKFKQFTVLQENTAMKVGVDAVILGAWTNPENAGNILDIGTGTGLLSLMMAQKSKALITAIEIDEKACEQAKINVQASNWSQRIEVLHASIQEFATKTAQQFDLIICNPPFFTNSLLSSDEKRNLARHDNLLPINELLQHSKRLLTDNGYLYLIYPYEKLNSLIKEAVQYGLYPAKTLIIKGTAQKQPNRFVVKLGFEKCQNIEETLVVRATETNEYTPDYKQLTKDFYLNF